MRAAELSVVLVLAATSLAPVATHASELDACSPAWVPTFGPPPATGVNNTVRAVASFGAGGPPALYVGGLFTTAGGLTVNRIAAWSGSAGAALGTGMNNTVYALAPFDDGSGAGTELFAGGLFTTAGGLPVNRIAKWNGSSWSPLGSGVSIVGSLIPYVSALLAFDDGTGSGTALYVGGHFTSAGGSLANRIARWNGTSWSKLGSGLNDAVFALAAFDDGSGAGRSLVAGGVFFASGGAAVLHVARWNGASWLPLSSGTDGVVYALAAVDHGSGSGATLYAAGLFTTAGGSPANNIAAWDGRTWSSLADGLNGTVWALASFDDGRGPALYAGGDFTLAGGRPANHIARWDGTSWSALEAGLGGAPTSSTYVLAAIGDASVPASSLYVGGNFTRSPAGDSFLAKWQGCSAACLADLDGDGGVGADDLALLLGAWNTTAVDLDGDGIAAASDLSILLGAWGACP